MEKVLLLHNPGAGDGDHMKSDLIRSIQDEGYECVYYAVKKQKDWKDHLDQAHFLVMVGGDGTIRQIVKELIKNDKLKNKIPIALLPKGTANNLSIALGIDDKLDINNHIKNWNINNRQKFNIGIVRNTEFQDFFLEGTGYGIFPELIYKMSDLKKNPINNSTDEIMHAQKMLLQITLSAKVDRYKIIADGQVYQGKCFLLEVMNTPSIGPNLILAPEAKIDDGYLNVVCLQQEQRNDFMAYMKQLIDGEEVSFDWKSIKAKSLTIECESKYMHVDDKLISPISKPIHLELRENLLEFLMPSHTNS